MSLFFYLIRFRTFSLFSDMEFETRLMEEREKQGVQSPLSYQISMAQGDIQQNGATNVDDSFGNISSYKLLQILLNDSWKASNSAEHHLKSIRRKIVNMLPKCIWSIKVIRLLFRVMGEKLDTIDQKQGDRSISNAICVDHRFTEGSCNWPNFRPKTESNRKC